MISFTFFHERHAKGNRRQQQPIYLRRDKTDLAANVEANILLGDYSCLELQTLGRLMLSIKNGKLDWRTKKTFQEHEELVAKNEQQVKLTAKILLL